MKSPASSAFALVMALWCSGYCVAQDAAGDVAVAQPDLTPAMLAVSSRLGRSKYVRSLFKQEKKLKVLKRPLLSRGHFLFSVEDGLYWQIDQPLYSALVVTDDAIYEKRDGQSIVVADARSQPIVGDFTALFKYLFSGKMALLGHNFELDFQGDEKSWTLALTPKSSNIGKVFRGISISGGENIDAISLREVNGDVTELLFYETVSGDQALSQQEQTYFE